MTGDPALGEICQFPYSFAPRNWSYCHGQILPIQQNTALYSLLGTTYGGDGKTTFALPDLRWRDDNGNILQLKTGNVYQGKVYIESFISLRGYFPSRG